MFLTALWLLYCKKQARSAVADFPDFKGFYERYLCSLSDIVCCFYYKHFMRALRGIHALCHRGAHTAPQISAWHNDARATSTSLRVNGFCLLYIINQHEPILYTPAGVRCLPHATDHHDARIPLQGAAAFQPERRENSLSKG